MVDGLAASVSSAGDVDRDGLGDVVVTTGRVYLAATLLTPPGDGDGDSEAGDSVALDTGGDEKGCGGRGGCDAAGAPGTFTGLLMVVATLRRRVDRRAP